MDVVEGADGLPVQLVTALLGTQANRGEAGVGCGAHEHHGVAVARPGLLHVARPGAQVVRSCHHPAEDAHLLEEHISYKVVLAWLNTAITRVKNTDSVEVNNKL